MKKIILLLLLINTFLVASSSDVEAKIYNSILSAIFPTKSNIRVWVDQESKKNILNQIEKVQLVETPADADICLVLESKHLKTKKLMFVGSYSLLKHYKESTIGGFFWQKGRPNIMFLGTNLKKHHIELPTKFDRYIESEL